MMPRSQSNIQGRIDTQQTARTQTRVPVDNLGLKWLFAHYATEWELVDGEWLPVLNRIHFRKGLNGQAEDGDPRAHILFITQKGGIVIEIGDPRLGRYRNYRKEWPAFNRTTKGLGFFYSSIFERPEIAGRHAKWKVNRRAYNDFRRLLVKNGVIMEVEPISIELKIDTSTGSVNHLKGLPATEQRTDRIKKMEQDLPLMIASLEKLREDIGEEDIDYQDDFQFDDVVDDSPEEDSRKRPGSGS